MTDHNGHLPSDEERYRLRAEAMLRIYQQWGFNPTRATLAWVPWFPADGDHPSWKAPLGEGVES